MSYGSQTNTVSTAAHAEVTSESEKGAVMLEISQRNLPEQKRTVHTSSIWYAPEWKLF